MKRFVLALFALSLTLVLTDCLSVRPEVREHRRGAHGDVFVAPVTPQPIVEGTPETIAEADVTSVVLSVTDADPLVSSVARKNIGRGWNEAGGCSVWFHFPKGVLEYRVQVKAGDCAKFGQPDLKREGEVPALVEVGTKTSGEKVMAQGFIRHTIDRDNDLDVEVCETWAHTNDIRLAPGYVSRKLRLLGGRNYTVTATKTPINGSKPYSVTYDLNPDPGVRDTYKGKKVTWALVNTSCYYFN